MNSFFLSENDESLIKSIGFLRFIFLTYAISYYLLLSDNKILKIWTLFFLIVSFDIIFEYSFGKNIFGLQSEYPGRISGFTGDELKIGGYYFGFIFLCLIFVKHYKKNLFLIFAIIFFIISLLIGERSNFIKIFIMYFLYFMFFYENSFIKKFIIVTFFALLSFLIVLSVPNLKNKFTNHIIEKETIKKFQKDGEELNYKKIISGNRHLSHYYVATNIFKENILFGSGFKSFRVKSYDKKYQGNQIYGASTHPHQFHFEILSELGLIGYILILSNLIYVLFNKSNFRYDLKRTGALLFIIASLVPILPSGSFFTSYGATIFFINYAFLIRPNDLNDIKNKSGQSYVVNSR